MPTFDKMSAPDIDNPEWTAEDFARARPASDILPSLIGKDAAEILLRRGRGRPTKTAPKVNQTLRLDAEVIAAYRALGTGWQRKINDVLRAHMPPGDR